MIIGAFERKLLTLGSLLTLLWVVFVCETQDMGPLRFGLYASILVLAGLPHFFRGNKKAAVWVLVMNLCFVGLFLAAWLSGPPKAKTAGTDEAPIQIPQRATSLTNWQGLLTLEGKKVFGALTCENLFGKGPGAVGSYLLTLGDGTILEGRYKIETNGDIRFGSLVFALRETKNGYTLEGVNSVEGSLHAK